MKKNRITIICKVCGVEVPDAGRNRKYCADCAKEVQREARRKYLKTSMAILSDGKQVADRHTAKHGNIAEDVRQAREAGMSYGQWRAKQIVGK